jgi:hypothetical protein
MSVINRYYGFGLDFQSAIPIPEMREGNIGHDMPVVVELARAACPKGLTQIADRVAAGPSDFWMDVPGIARLHVSEGTKISIEAAPDAALGDVRAYLLGSAMGALLHQREFLPLHASAVEIEGQAVAFCGSSGAGKSTLALHLAKRGHPMLCDDICAIDVSSGAPHLWPGLINLKLWRESLETVSEDHQALQPVLATLDKYKLPMRGAAKYQRYQLSHIFSLGVFEQQQPTAQILRGGEGLSALVANTFRGQLVNPMLQDKRHFDQCINTRSHASVYKLARPWSLPDIEASCKTVESVVRMS